MHDGSGRIVVQDLSKNFGKVTAVQDLSFTVEPGSVTGFIGPNGAGKTTTLRMILGLVQPTAGTTTVNGVPFHQLVNPAAIGVPDQRAAEVLDLVGLGTAAKRKVGGFSLGMRQRLALATALLGDPQVLVLDEPANGLDPEGIAWLRQFLRSFAREGRTVIVSSHLLAELEQTVDQVVIISQGRAKFYGQLDQLRQERKSRVLVRAGDPAALVDALQRARFADVESTQDGRIAVAGATAQQVGDIAVQAGIALYGIEEERVELEQLFFQLTSGAYSSRADGHHEPWGGQA